MEKPSQDYFFGELNQPAVVMGLRRGQSVSEIALAQQYTMESILSAIAYRVKFVLPACLLIHFEPAQKKVALILEPYNLFQIVRRDMTKGKALMTDLVTGLGSHSPLRASVCIVHHIWRLTS